MRRTPHGPLWLRVVLTACWSLDFDPATRTAHLGPGDLRHRLDPTGFTTAPQVAAAIATAKRHGWLTDDSNAQRLTLTEGVPLVVVQPEQLAPTAELVTMLCTLWPSPPLMAPRPPMIVLATVDEIVANASDLMLTTR